MSFKLNFHTCVIMLLVVLIKLHNINSFVIQQIHVLKIENEVDDVPSDMINNIINNEMMLFKLPFINENHDSDNSGGDDIFNIIQKAHQQLQNTADRIRNPFDQSDLIGNANNDNPLNKPLSFGMDTLGSINNDKLRDGKPIGFGLDTLGNSGSDDTKPSKRVIEKHNELGLDHLKQNSNKAKNNDYNSEDNNIQSMRVAKENIKDNHSAHNNAADDTNELQQGDLSEDLSKQIGVGVYDTDSNPIKIIFNENHGLQQKNTKNEYNLNKNVLLTKLKKRDENAENNELQRRELSDGVESERNDLHRRELSDGVDVNNVDNCTASLVTCSTTPCTTTTPLPTTTTCETTTTTPCTTTTTCETTTTPCTTTTTPCTTTTTCETTTTPCTTTTTPPPTTTCETTTTSCTTLTPSTTTVPPCHQSNSGQNAPSSGGSAGTGGAGGSTASTSGGILGYFGY